MAHPSLEPNAGRSGYLSAADENDAPAGAHATARGTFFSLKDNASLLRVQSLDNALDGLLGHVVHHAAADKVEDDMAPGCASCQHRPEVPLGPASRATFRTGG